MLDEMSKKILDLKPQWEALKPALPQSFRGVVVACSGGLDSTALFWLFQDLVKREKNFSLAVTHVAYGLRGGESEGDFDFVRDLADRAGIPFFPYRVSAEEHSAREGRGVQAWAREIRRAHFKRLGAEGWVVALAHHLDDQAETAIFRLARGASPGKLLGMKPWAPPLWRPLLAIPRGSLVDYVVHNQISYREDSSNAKLDYARNVIRHQVIPTLSQLFPGAVSRIVACASEAASLAEIKNSSLLSRQFNESAMANPVAQTTTRDAMGASLHSAEMGQLAVFWLKSRPREEARDQLARWIHSQTSSRRQLSRRWLDMVLGQLEKDGTSGRIADLPGGGFVEVDSQGHLIVRGIVPSFDLANSDRSQTSAPKDKRRSQHERALKGPGEMLLLEPGSQAFLNRSMASKTVIAYRKVPQIADLYPIRYKVYGGAAANTFAYPGQQKFWTGKSQLAAWGVPDQERTRWRFLEASGIALGMTDGRYVLRPGLKDDVIRDDQYKSDFSNDHRYQRRR